MELTRIECIRVIERSSEALFNYCKENNIHHVVTGSSGGIDSAVTLGFADKAVQLASDNGYNLTSVGLIMPCHSMPEAEVLGRQAITRFDAKEVYKDFSDIFDYIMDAVIGDINGQVYKILRETGAEQTAKEAEWIQKITQGNIKARLRMMLGTYHVARLMKGMVLSTDNLSEFWMAFWTICGDVGDYGMIQNLLKGSEIYDLARYLNVPQGIIDAKPDDGLGVSGGDEVQIGAGYPIVDRVMIKLIQRGFDPDGPLAQLNNLPKIKYASSETVRKIAERALRGSFKRKGTVVLSREFLGLPSIKSIVL